MLNILWRKKGGRTLGFSFLHKIQYALKSYQLLLFILSLSEWKVSAFPLFIFPVHLNRPKDIKLVPGDYFCFQTF